MRGLATGRVGALAVIAFAAFGAVPLVATEAPEPRIDKKVTSRPCLSFFVCDQADAPLPEYDVELRNADDDSVPAGADETDVTPSDVADAILCGTRTPWGEENGGCTE